MYYRRLFNKDIPMSDQEKNYILVSACLLGDNCKYNGGNNYVEHIERLKERYTIIPCCPEVLGGLTTPRAPAERIQEYVRCASGEDVTKEFHRGALITLALVEKYHCRYAVLKSRSPSCGKGQIYDGTFSKRLVDGNGVTTELLLKHGIQVYTEHDIENNIL